ncbi:MAG: hypothetical protein NZM43_06400 [Saprospiraceae bacterium]|nr:hypothetical protein [Saprospiraceae bacterium]MDW8483942.1 hypothetical protein [Saprospiraceae bacterium]
MAEGQQAQLEKQTEEIVPRPAALDTELDRQRHLRTAVLQPSPVGLLIAHAQPPTCLAFVAEDAGRSGMDPTVPRTLRCTAFGLRTHAHPQ